MLSQVAKLVALLGLIQVLAAGSRCGIPRIKHQPLIVHGNPTQPGEWPWHAGVYHRSGRNSRYACGGTLISTEFVVTAAHCTLDEGTNYRLTRKRMFVRVGVHNLDRMDPDATQQHTIAEIHMFANFSRDNLQNDIALLELDAMVRMTDYVVPACVNRIVELDGVVGTAVGWGVTEDDEISPELKKVSLPVVDNVECLESDRDLFGTMMHKGMFCAGYQNGSSVCNGDSGGGLFFNRDETWYLGGIVSFQKFRRHGTNLCYTEGYAAFTNVAKYLDWIGNITGMDFKKAVEIRTTTAAPKRDLEFLTVLESAIEVLKFKTYYFRITKLSFAECYEYVASRKPNYYDANTVTIRDNGVQTCIANIISERYLLSSGHCAYDKFSRMPHHSAMTVSVTQPQPPMDITCRPSSPGMSGGGAGSGGSMTAATATTTSGTSRPSSAASSSPANSSGGSSEADPMAGTPASASSSTSSTAANPSTALRRFYFQKTRVSKSPKAASIAGTGTTVAATAMTMNAATAAGNSVPKVVVMGSSTTSEATTINTSTDSASTHVTNVTVTTDTETNDSIDLGEGSGQSEPLLSSLDDESSSIVMNQSFGDGDDENITVINGGPDTPLLISYQELEDMSPKSPKTSPKPGCRTAPVASTTRFPFDPPPSPRSVRILPKTSGAATGHSSGSSSSSGGGHQESMFNFDESPNPVRRPPPKMASPSEFHQPEVSVLLHGKDGGNNKENLVGTPSKRGSPYKSRKERFMQQQQQQHYSKQSGKPLNSAPAASCQKGVGGQNYDPNMTMFPFDREAIDYDRIQRECFAVEEEFPFERNRDDYCCESPSRANMDSEIFGDHYSIFQQYAYLTQQERDALDRTPTKRNKKDRIDAFSPKKQPPPPPQLSPQRMSKFDQIATKFDMMPSKHELMTKGRTKRTTTGGGGGLPDLRVDFFAETSCCDDGLSASKHAADGVGKTHAPPTSSQPAGSSRSSGAAEAVGAGALATGAINVTPNPMDSAVCTQPRATIVVQQPSLSLDYSSVETILLKNEGDFISVEQGKELSRQKKKQQREDNMRQLLDVTNTLTTEEIKDFEMRYGSPHHSRSQSVKTPGSRASGRPNQLCLPQQRSRVASMPNTGVEEEYYRLRHFSITGKGVVNRGDSLKSRRSKSNNSVASSNSSTEHLTAVGAGSARTSATCSLASSRESSTSNPASGPYKVLMLGGAAVGKSSLVSQFMTSEYLHAYDTSIDDDSGEKTVSVLLSGEESEITFIDHSYMEMTPENCMSSYDPHGYCVIYSSSDRSSFQIAEEILQVLWTSENIAQKAVILVANKADLARSRMVTSDEGKQMATQYDCKFIETSVGINHNVDELLVGLLSQIRLKLENPEKSRDLFRKRSIRKSKRRACSPLGGAICLSGMGGGTNPSTPVAATPSSAGGGGIGGGSGLGGGGGGGFSVETPPGSAHSSPRQKYRGSRTSASLKVKGLLGRVWARDSKSKSCENLHVL